MIPFHFFAYKTLYRQSLFPQYFGSSGISEYPLTSQYDPDQSSYWSVLSTSGGGGISKVQEKYKFSELPRCADPNESLLLHPCITAEAPAHRISIASPQLLQQPQNGRLSVESVLDPQIFTEECDINYPLTYSNEADLAAAAITGEINTARNSACSNVCDFESDLNYFGAHGETAILPNTLSNPFELIPSEF